ncbi:enoyl-CoA hydratase/isomerase family protein [Mycolicibacterium septicum]|nr:enoyl-CoA hydratase/isomerase family protein [Mycolicibacterium septicum]
MQAVKLVSNYVEVTTTAGIAVVRLNRPESLNALNDDMRRDIAESFRHYGNDRSIRGIVLTGTGRAFSSGADLYALSSAPDSIIEETESFHDMTRAALSTSVPVVAAINGIAVGGAAELTLCLDARIGSPTAEYYFPENHRGLVISNASSYLLRRLVGSKVIDVILSSRRMAAEEALRLGLLDEVVDQDPVAAATRLIERWTPEGSAVRQHLDLLRPSLDTAEKAFQRESAAVRDAHDAGLSAVGLSKFAARTRC